MKTNKCISVIGGGFAGVEAAKQAAKRGIRVKLYEMKPKKFSPAHKSEKLCELVCSNSFKSTNPSSAAGLLKNEMELLDSVCVNCAKETAVPAGGALAVDREKFSQAVTDIIENDKQIELIREEVVEIPSSGIVIVAVGPLASDSISESIRKKCGDILSFYDAAAPVVSAESVDMSKTFAQSRYDRGSDDYINCPMDKEEYEAFYKALVNAETATRHDFDKGGVYESCIPIEIMAKRGENTLRFGPMKPIGLTNPLTGHRPWAVLQLRKENRAGSMYNLVGFQTSLKFSEQKKVFSLIPALKNAVFVRYGVMHRNSFINSPKALTSYFNMKEEPDIFFAGQITGVEGYMESAASGIAAGINAARRFKGEKELLFPKTTMIRALSEYISDSTAKDFQPMGASLGLLPEHKTEIKNKKERYAAICSLALEDMKKFIAENL